MKRFFLLLLPLFLLTSSFAQDWIKTGTGLGVEKVRLAVPDFNASTQDPKNADLLKAFNETLWNDLDNAGIFDMVSKSFYPLGQVGTPADVKFEGWSAPPPNAAMLAFGNLGVSGNGMTVQGWLYDVKNVTSPQVLGKQYQDAATNDAARTTAHKFADEIIFRLGGGIAGNRGKQDLFREQPQRAQGNLGHGLRRRQPARRDPSGLDFVVAAGLARRVAHRLQFHDQGGLGNSDVFPRPGPPGFISPVRWNQSFSGMVSGRNQNRFLVLAQRRSEIYTVDSAGANLKRITSFKGPDVSPAWNRKTGAQIAWVSGRTGLPQVYTMEADGTNVQRLTDQGYAVSPAWSPNGQFLVVSWMRKYGPGAPGAQDIYIMDIASKQWVQLTHDGGRNDFPYWSPDGRHIIFQSSRAGSLQIWTMLADGTNQKQLTFAGANSQPNWSWK